MHLNEVVLYDNPGRKAEDHRAAVPSCSGKRKQESLKVRAAGTPREALEGAKYVVTTLRVGGDHSRVTDEKIALEHGVIGQETTGVGGTFPWQCGRFPFFWNTAG